MDLLGLARARERRTDLGGERAAHRVDGGADRALARAAHRDVEVVADDLQVLRDRDELACDDLAVAPAHVEDALVRVDRIEDGRRGVAARVERETRPEGDPHAEHLERVVLEGDHVASPLDLELLAARCEPGGETKLGL